MDQHPPLDFQKITENIFIGTNACCAGHFNEQLLAIGIANDLSLEEVHIDTPFGATSYLWLPVKNHGAPTVLQFRLGVAYLSQITASGEKVYVHCKNGHGRAPTMVAAFLIVHEQKSVDDAIKFVFERRHGVHIEDEQHAALDAFAHPALKE